MCPGCGEIFASKAELKEHRKEAHGLLTPMGKSSLGASLVALGLRVYLGSVMIIHGYPKLTSRKKQTKQAMKGIGVPEPLTTMASLLEVVGGAALIAGFLVPVVSSLFAAE